MKYSNEGCSENIFPDLVNVLMKNYKKFQNEI